MTYAAATRLLHDGDVLGRQRKPVEGLWRLRQGALRVCFERMAGSGEPVQEIPAGALQPIDGAICIWDYDSRTWAATVRAVGETELERVAEGLPSEAEPTGACEALRGLAAWAQQLRRGLEVLAREASVIEALVNDFCPRYRRLVDNLEPHARRSLEVRNLVTAARRRFSYRRGGQNVERRRHPAVPAPRQIPLKPRPHQTLLVDGQPIDQLLRLDEGRLERVVAGQVVECFDAPALIGLAALLPVPANGNIGTLRATSACALSLAPASSAINDDASAAGLLHGVAAANMGARSAMLRLHKRLCALQTALVGEQTGCLADCRALVADASRLSTPLTPAWTEAADLLRQDAEQAADAHRQRDDKLRERLQQGWSWPQVRVAAMVEDMQQRLSGVLTGLCRAAMAPPAAQDGASARVRMAGLQRLAEDVVREAEVWRSAGPSRLTADAADLPAHSVGTAFWAVCLAAQMGLDAEVRQQLALGCLLHDVGTIRPPDDDDYRPQFHTQDYAEQWLWPLGELPRPVAEIIVQHHEMRSGEGLPRGLRGKQIAPLARIAALANYADLLTRRGFSWADVAQGVRQHARHFDGVCVQALYGLLG